MGQDSDGPNPEIRSECNFGSAGKLLKNVQDWNKSRTQAAASPGGGRRQVFKWVSLYLHVKGDPFHLLRLLVPRITLQMGLTLCTYKEKPILGTSFPERLGEVRTHTANISQGHCSLGNIANSNKGTLWLKHPWERGEGKDMPPYPLPGTLEPKITF